MQLPPIPSKSFVVLQPDNNANGPMSIAIPPDGRQPIAVAQTSATQSRIAALRQALPPAGGTTRTLTKLAAFSVAASTGACAAGAVLNRRGDDTQSSTGASSVADSAAQYAGNFLLGAGSVVGLTSVALTAFAVQSFRNDAALMRQGRPDPEHLAPMETIELAGAAPDGAAQGAAPGTARTEPQAHDSATGSDARALEMTEIKPGDSETR